MKFEYRLKRQLETIGPVQLEIECLEDMNQTIDQIFEYLEKNGNPQDLEKLCPYFGVVWPAALGLAQYLLTPPSHDFEKKKVLELGCGLGIPSIIASKRGAKVTATDTHVDVPRFLEKNLLINSIGSLDPIGSLGSLSSIEPNQPFQYRQVDWESENPDLGQFDWVIGSDILYERRYAETLASAVAKRILPHGKIVIADPGRPYLQNFADLMSAQGFSYTTLIQTVSGFAGAQDVFVLVFEKN